MKHILVLIFLSFALLGLSQNPKDRVEQDTTELIFSNRPETQPIHISGNDKNLISALYENLCYSCEKCLGGTTILSFKIDTSGFVVDPKILRSIDSQIDQQLLKEICNHTFIPGTLYGKKVKTTMHIPIRICMSK